MAKKKKAGEDTAKLSERIVQAVTDKAVHSKKSGKTSPNKYELHPCYSIQVGCRTYTSRNLTDKVAEEYLANGGGRHWFKKLPN